MESLILLLLITIGGSSGFGFGYYDHCNIAQQCDSTLPPEFLQMMSDFPPNEIQLKELCPPILNLGECYKTVVQDCIGQTLEELASSENETLSMTANFLNNLFKLNIDVCDEETQLSKNYIDNIQCFKEMHASSGDECREEGKRMLEAYRMSLPNVEGEEDETVEQIEATCISTAYQMVCAMKQVQETCGETAKDVYLEVIRRLQILKLGICSERDLMRLRERFGDFLEEQGEQPEVLFVAFSNNIKRYKRLPDGSLAVVSRK